MKSEAPQSIKFLKLKRRTKLPHWQVVGLLESIWLFTVLNAQSGDIGRFSNEDIAASIEWEGDAEKLITDLVECGWLDRSEYHRLVIHDWEKHCPNYVKGNMIKYQKDFARATSPNDAPREPRRDAPREPRRDAPRDIPSRARVLPNPTQPNQTKEPPNPPQAGGDVSPPKKKREPKPPEPRAEIPPSLDTPEFREIWEIRYSERIKSKFPYTYQGERLALKKLIRLTVSEAIEWVENAIASNHRGIFPPSMNANGKAKSSAAPIPKSSFDIPKTTEELDRERKRQEQYDTDGRELARMYKARGEPLPPDLEKYA